MPVYDFKCSNCNHQSEVMRKMSESSLTICPACKQETFAKMLSAPSFQLNGTGYYATDFKDKKPKSAAINAVKDVAKTTTAESAAPNATKSCAPGCACH